jgi:hypothetical protein
MSWFKHKPRPKTAPKLHAHHSSPIAEKILKETKREVTKVTSTVEKQDLQLKLKKKKRNDG